MLSFKYGAIGVALLLVGLSVVGCGEKEKATDATSNSITPKPHQAGAVEMIPGAKQRASGGASGASSPVTRGGNDLSQ